MFPAISEAPPQVLIISHLLFSVRARDGSIRAAEASHDSVIVIRMFDDFLNLDAPIFYYDYHGPCNDSAGQGCQCVSALFSLLRDLHALNALSYHPFREGICHLCDYVDQSSHFASISRLWWWVTSKPVGLAF